MNKIKIVGALIFILSISLALLSNTISNNNRKNIQILQNINKQKAFTQEVSKNIFYIYKNQNASQSYLDDEIRRFVKSADMIDVKLPKEIVLLWNDFYLKVQKFRDINKVTTAYSNVLLEKILNDIYITNIKLVVDFDKLLEKQKNTFDKKQKIMKFVEYILYLILLSLLMYLFTQLKSIILFMQKFLRTSKKIINNSSIKGVKPIEIDKHTQNILEATNNFNFLIEKINNSINNSTKSIKHSYVSIEVVEKNIEELLELLYTMDDDKTLGKEMAKKEDAIIQSLEELTNASKKLQNLKEDIDNLTRVKLSSL